METLVLGIGGMQSGACAGNIEKRLYGVTGVQSAAVSFSLEAAEIVYDPALTDAARLASVVAAAGYAPHLGGAVVSGVPAGSGAQYGKSHTNSGCG